MADSGNNRIRKITSAGVVTTVAGNDNFDSVDGDGTAASFKNPIGLALDSLGDLYVADFSGNKIRRLHFTLSTN